MPVCVSKLPQRYKIKFNPQNFCFENFTKQHRTQFTKPHFSNQNKKSKT